MEVSDYNAQTGVYALIDPRTQRVMYIGQSHDIERRFRQHLDYEHNDLHHLEKRAWIGNLVGQGLQPILKVLLSLPQFSYVKLNEEERPKPKVRNIRSVFEAQVGEHSSKPEEFYKIVEAISDGPYTELFARRERGGLWTCYGNEVTVAEPEEYRAPDALPNQTALPVV